jgi:hypothetical protein
MLSGSIRREEEKYKLPLKTFLSGKSADNLIVMKINSNVLVKILFLTVCLNAGGPLLWSQSGGDGVRAGSIVFASGGAFDIVREGRKRNYDPAVEYVEDTEIRVGDYINTYADAFLEIVLEPGDRILKISEHTSLKIPMAENNGTQTRAVQLAYGRVRAKVLSLAGGRSFQVRGPSMVAGVRGTDFGYDLLATAGSSGDSGSGSPVRETVYCLEGSVNVIPRDGEEARLIEAGEMVVRDYSEEKAGSGLSVLPIEEAITSYWNRNVFVTLLDAGADAPESEEEKKDVVLDWDAEAYRKAAAVTGISGVLLAGAAASLWYMDDYFSGMNGREGIATALAASGGIFLSASILSLIMASSAD